MPSSWRRAWHSTCRREYLEGVKFDDHGNISLSQTNLARNMTKLVEAEYEKRQGKKRRVTGVQLGYEARCALPHAFDVILGSQLGVGTTGPWWKTAPTGSWSRFRGSSTSIMFPSTP